MIQFAWPESPEGFREEMAAQYFIDEIIDPQIQNTLRLGGFKNSTEALARALELEAVRSIHKSRVRAVTIKEPVPDATSESQTLQKLQRRLDILESRHALIDPTAPRHASVAVKEGISRGIAELSYRRGPLFRIEGTQQPDHGRLLQPHLAHMHVRGLYLL